MASGGRRRPPPDAPRAEGDIRWSTPDQWHVTLRFLGDVDPQAAVEAVARVRSHPSRRSCIRRPAGWATPSCGP
ncbi:MAG: 2'-5' RNA ligase family protein [Acidimicrobiales bacterium]